MLYGVLDSLAKVIGFKAGTFCTGVEDRGMQGVPYIKAPKGSSQYPAALVRVADKV